MDGLERSAGSWAGVLGATVLLLAMGEGGIGGRREKLRYIERFFFLTTVSQGIAGGRNGKCQRAIRRN